MGSLTNYAEVAFLKHICLEAAYSPATTIYLALCTADPTDAATGASMNECANTGSYARTAITFAAAASRSVAQNADVDFPQATGSWGTVSHWAIVDTNTYGSGNVLAHGAFASSKAVGSGDTPSVASGEVTVSFNAGEVSNYAANGFLDRMFRNQAFTVSATYLGLTTVIVTDGMTGSTITEPGSGAYAREQVNANGGAAPDWNLVTSGDPSYVDNNDDVTFTTATGDWGTITSVVMCDASSAGNLLMYDNDVTDKAVNNGDTAKITAGNCDWQCS